MTTTETTTGRSSSRPSPNGERRARGFRVLLTNEPRSYREAIAAAVLSAGPAGMEVFVAEAGELDREVRWLVPDLLVCSHLSATAEARVASWVDLYPDLGSQSRIGMNGERTTVRDIDLLALLLVVERARKLAAEMQIKPLGTVPRIASPHLHRNDGHEGALGGLESHANSHKPRGRSSP